MKLAVPLVVVWALVSIPTALWMFDHDDRTVVIGAHTTTVSPTFDAHATLDFGPLLPRLRMPVDAPFDLGVSIDVGDTDVNDLDELFARDAVIAAQPEGEIGKVQSHLIGMAVDSALRGAGVGLIATLMIAVGWHVTGRERRALVWRRVRDVRSASRKELGIGGLTLLLFVGAIVLITVPTGPEPESAADSGWRPVPDVIPGTGDIEELDRIELSTGSATRGGVTLIEGALQTYRESQEFYGDMEDRVPEIAKDIRKPDDEQTLAVLISDRHDNIGMDPVVAAIAREARAELIIDAGDDTSTGGPWEAFSINSMERAYEDFDKVAVAGNHDKGGFVREALEDAGFEVLDGEPVEVAGIRFLGASDPRSSGLTAGYGEDSGSIEDQGEELADVACEDEDVSTVLVHSPTTGEPIARSGCTDLILSGHLHRQVGPDTVTGEEGVTTTYTNGTTGGAAYAFALGSKLRRPAQVTLVTYEDGRPIGLQPVNFDTGGHIHVADFEEIVTDTSIEKDADEAQKDTDEAEDKATDDNGGDEAEGSQE
ncbi:metallophosphoesterase family protein [Solicola gregarius]|uniref:Metallophosphoesterase family protein n=1 Tax=Solicola gregarius TaxID=2908642 RepID=A0AA46TLK1_9ACTN|nr:metallophosphoesterase [Solicola gregarius]UYM07157.1 metallophosphoesterase family protein [Solicola gregarius]